MSSYLAPLLAVMSFSWPAGGGARAGGESPATNVRVDQYGDPLPDRAVLRIGTTRWRLHESPLVFAPNGRHAIACGETTRLVDAVTGNVLRVFPVRSFTAFFAPDNKTVILGCGEKIHWLDVETGKITRQVTINGYARPAWSADGNRLVCMYQTRPNWDYRVWNLDRCVELCRWERPYGACALSPDGTLLAVRSTREIGVFSVADKKPVCQWNSQEPNAGRGPNAHVVLFLPDGKTLAAAESNRVVLWNAATGKLKAKGKLGPTLKTGLDDPVTLAASADGRYLAAGGSKGAVYVWDVQTGVLLHRLPAADYSLPVYTLSFTPDGKRLVSQGHVFFPSARVWDVANGKELSPAPLTTSTVVFSPDGKALATGGVQLWDAASGKFLRQFAGGSSFAFHRNGKALVTARGDEVAIWNLSDGALRHRTRSAIPNGAPGDDPKHFSWTCLSPGEDTLIAVFSGDVRRVVPARRKNPGRTVYWTMIGIADATTGKVLRSFRVEAEYLYWRYECLSPDGRMLAAIGSLPDRPGNIQPVLIWSLDRGVELFHADLPQNHLAESLGFSADSRTLFLTSSCAFTTHKEHSFRVFEIASGKPRAEFIQKLDRRMAISRGAIGSDRLAAVIKDATISLFDPLTGKEYGELHSSQDRIGRLAFSPDARRLASAADANVLIWDIADLAPPPARARLADDDLAQLWAALSSDRAEIAFRAIRQLAEVPDQAVAYLGKQLQPVTPIPEAKIKALVAQLDSPEFAQREQAGRQLLQLPDLAEPALAEARKNPPSLEARRRIEALSAMLREMKAKGPWTLSGEPLREARATEVLERIGTPGAKRLLERLAQGASHAIMTREARSAAQRLKERTGRQ
jgi:WD40 repeat protein